MLDGPMTTSLRSVNLSEQLTELGKTLLYLYWFVIKHTSQEQRHGRDAQGKVWREGTELSYPL